MNYYDLVIVGAGPTGLALAHCCSSLNIKILVIDKEDVIGGCHRVKRINNLFTEHSPRVYFSNYKNVFKLLAEANLHKDDIFTDYDSTFFSMLSKDILPSLSLREIAIYVSNYMYFLYDEDYGKDINFKTFCLKHQFSNKAIETLDRVCRFMDGAPIDKYSLNTMLKVANTILHILQPKGPLDKLVFEKWQQFLESRNVDFQLGQEVKHITYNKNTRLIENVILTNNKTFYVKQLVFAIPPTALIRLLKHQPEDIKNSFGDYNTLYVWAEKTEYLEYISMTFHYKKPINLPRIGGNTMHTEWGIMMINLSNYMKDIEDKYETVISICLSICDRPSKMIHKTANQCTDKEELCKEAHRQLKQELFPELPDYDLALLNPNNYYDPFQNKWKSTDDAFFHSVGSKFIPNHSTSIKNIYNVGTHNGHHYITHTTMESAVSNGIALACSLYPSVKAKYKVETVITIKEIIIITLISCMLLLLIWLIWKVYI